MKSFRKIEKDEPVVDGGLDGIEPRVKVVPAETDEKTSAFTLEYEFPGFWFNYEKQNHFFISGQDVFFTQIKIPGAGFMNEKNKPLLPSFGRYLQIPFSRTLNSYSARVVADTPVTEEMRKHTDGRDIRVKRSEHEVIDVLHGNLIEESKGWSRADFGLDHIGPFFRRFYKKSQQYPAPGEIVEITGPYLIDGYKALLVHVRPFQYLDSKKSQLVFHSTIHVEIELQPDNSFRPENPDCYAGAYENLFLNPERQESRGPKDSEDPEMLIIYGKEDFREAAEQLREWKERKGLKTDMVSVAKIESEIGNEAVSKFERDPKVSKTARKIRDYIFSRRNADMSRLRYVLLLGDVGMDDVPVDRNSQSDYYYCTDEDLASSDEPRLIFPKIACGRIPVKTKDEADLVVNKIVKYEQFPDMDRDYYRRIALCAYLEESFYGWQNIHKDDRDSNNYAKTMNDIAIHLETFGFVIDRIYTEQRGATIKNFCNGRALTKDVQGSKLSEVDAEKKMLSVANGGRLIIGHRGHGCKEKWLFPGFDPVKLNPKTPPSIFFSLNCLTGQFDQDPDCMAERLLKHDGAAPSLIAPTRSSNTWLNNSMMKALFDALWPGILARFPDRSGKALKNFRLGDIMNYAKAYLPIAQSKADSEISRHFEIYHLVGDPSLEVWKAEPDNFEIYANIEDGYLVVRCELCHFPQGAIFTICSGEGESFQVHKRIRGQSSAPLTEKMEDLFGESPPEGDISVCFHAPGYLFKEKVVK